MRRPPVGFDQGKVMDVNPLELPKSPRRATVRSSRSMVLAALAVLPLEGCMRPLTALIVRGDRQAPMPGRAG
jgi:hypothetical protein